MTNIYDVNNRRIGLVDPRNNRTSFSYDLAGNETLVNDALGRMVQKTKRGPTR